MDSQNDSGAAPRFKDKTAHGEVGSFAGSQSQRWFCSKEPALELPATKAAVFVSLQGLRCREGVS